MLLNSNGRGRLLRKIKKVKIDFYIRDLSPTLWLDASVNNLTLNGTSNPKGVSQIKDLSGNNIHAVQTNPARQPYYYQSTNYVYFDASVLHFLSCGDSNLLDLNGQDLYSIAVISRINTSIYSGAIFGKHSNTSNSGRYRVVATSSTSITGYRDEIGTGSAQSLSYASAEAESPMICGQIIDDGNGHFIHRNGIISSLRAYSTSGGSNNIRFLIGARDANGISETEHNSFLLYELIILRSIPSTEQRQLLEARLAYKWGFNGSILNSTHPYKDMPPTDNYIIIKYISYQIVDVGNAREQRITFEVKRHTPYGISSINYAVEGAGSDPAISSDFVGDVYPSGSIDFSANPYNLVIATKANSYRQLLVRLMNPVNSTIGTSTATASIVKALRYSAFLHLDAANTNTFQLSGNLITQWNDVSGNNYHAVAITSGREPVYNAVDKKVVFTNNRLRFPDMADPGDILDVFFVFDHTYLMGLFDAAPGSGGRIGNLSLGSWVRHGGNSIALNVPVSTLSMIYVSHTGISMRYYRDGEFITSVSSGAFSWSLGNVQIGGVNSGFEFVGSIREIVFFNRNLSDQERQLMESDLTHKWGIAGRLPSDHPYKNAPAP
jgi:hypothetical protein